MTTASGAFTALRITADSWLTGVMERPVFRVGVDAALLSAAEVEPLRAHAADHAGAMYFAKVDIGDVAAVRDLGRAGMYVVDVSVFLEAPAEVPAGPAVSAVVVDDCRAEDAASVLDIAGSCFRYSRFHVDPAVPLPVAHRVKREWIANYVSRQRGERLLVARVDGEPAGFLAVMSGVEGASRLHLIDLVGVDASMQGRGVGSALVAAFLASAPADAKRRVATQASNTPSLALYARCGFRTTGAGYVLHMHA